MTAKRSGSRGALVARTAIEVVLVFFGVVAALWIDQVREGQARRDRALDIAEAMSVEIGTLNDWYAPWRDSIKLGYDAWLQQVDAGAQPPPFYFRQPGNESPPTTGWDVGLASGLLETFDPALVFEVGNMYTEWNGIGARIARYHAATEALVFPAVSDPGRAWRPGPSRSVRYPVSFGDSVEVSGRLRPEFAANLVMMHEILAEMDDKYAWALRVRGMLDSAVAEVRDRAPR